MKKSLKTGFAQIFSCCPKNAELPQIWGGCSPPRPTGPYAYAFVSFLFLRLAFSFFFYAAHCLNILETFRGIHLVSIVSFINLFDKLSSFLRLRVHLPTKTADRQSECWVNSCFAEETACIGSCLLQSSSSTTVHVEFAL